MTDVVDELVAAIAQACGEEHRAKIEALADDARHACRRAAVLEQEIESRRAGALAELRRAHAAHFGAPSGAVERIAAALDARTLELTSIIVADSETTEQLAARLQVLERACIEERMKGASRVLCRQLERRFGPAVAYDYYDVCRVASADDLDACFARLESARSAAEVLAPMLRRLDDRVRDVARRMPDGDSHRRRE